MNLHLHREPGCTCLDLADRIRYGLEQIDPPLCSVHQRAEIDEREAVRLRAVADAEQARFAEVRASLEPAAPACSCPDIGTSLRAALERVALAACAAHPSETSPMALNDNDGIVSILRGALGRDTTVNQFPGDWPPDAA